MVSDAGRMKYVECVWGVWLTFPLLQYKHLQTNRLNILFIYSYSYIRLLGLHLPSLPPDCFFIPHAPLNKLSVRFTAFYHQISRVSLPVGLAGCCFSARMDGWMHGWLGGVGSVVGVLVWQVFKAAGLLQNLVCRWRLQHGKFTREGKAQGEKLERNTAELERITCVTCEAFLLFSVWVCVQMMSSCSHKYLIT